MEAQFTSLDDGPAGMLSVAGRPAPFCGMQALAAGLFWPEDVKVLAIWGYFDESGEHDPDTNRLLNMSVGGVYAPLANWQALETEWRRVLADEGLESFHMAPFEGWRKQFDFRLANGDRDRRRHDRILNALLDLMIEYIDGFYGFGAVSQFDPDQQAVTDRQLLMDCARGVIKSAVLDASEYYGEPVNLVFASQNRLSLDHLQACRAEYDYRHNAIGDITMKSAASVAPLQCADIFAYEIARAQRINAPDRYPFRRLCDGAGSKGRTFSVQWGPVRRRPEARS
jgi:hypothetical protein